MNAGNFHEFIKNPSMLHQVSYQELKSLMLQYPYAANLRYLMLVKSLFDNNKEYDRNLALASLGSIDRKKLFELVQKYNQPQAMEESFEIAEEFLELKDLSSLEEVDATPPEENTVKAQAAPLNFSDSNDPVDFLDDLLEAATSPKEEDTPAAKADGSLLTLEDLLDHETGPGESAEDDATEPKGDMLLDDLEAPLTTNEDLEDEKPLEKLNGFIEENDAYDSLENQDDVPKESVAPDSPTPAPQDILLEKDNELENGDSGMEQSDEQSTPKPSPKEAFSSWKQANEHKPGIHDEDMDAMDHSAKKSSLEEEIYDEPEDVANDMAKNSLLEDRSIVTETLAGILERQGHNDKAIAMYKKLSLQYPEKSSFFAAKIEKLKKK